MSRFLERNDSNTAEHFSHGLDESLTIVLRTTFFLLVHSTSKIHQLQNVSNPTSMSKGLEIRRRLARLRGCGKDILRSISALAGTPISPYVPYPDSIPGARQGMCNHKIVMICRSSQRMLSQPQQCKDQCEGADASEEDGTDTVWWWIC
jgi:hypothetical protein